MTLEDRIPHLEKILTAEIDEAEAELRAIQRETSLSAESGCRSHWYPVMTRLQQGKENETLFALIHVVQRVLDEKAQKAAATDKASNAYVDSLFTRVTGGVQDSLRQCMSESVSRLQEMIMEVHRKMKDLRKFLQVELHDIETELVDLQRLRSTANTKAQGFEY
jgi:hypothetical protein